MKPQNLANIPYPGLLKSITKKKRLSASQGQENLYFRGLLNESLVPRKKQRTLLCLGLCQVIRVGNKISYHTRAFVWLGKGVVVFSAYPLAVCVVGESSLIGPRGEKTALAFMIHQQKEVGEAPGDLSALSQ